MASYYNPNFIGYQEGGIVPWHDFWPPVKFFQKAVKRLHYISEIFFKVRITKVAHMFPIFNNYILKLLYVI